MQDRIEAFRDHLIAEERSPATIRSYLYAVRLYFREHDTLDKAGTACQKALDKLVEAAEAAGVEDAAELLEF